MAIVVIALILVVYVHMPLWLTLAMMFLIGLGATAEMIAFMVASDEAGGPLTGTSAAFVNAFMFITGGILMNIPSSLEAHGNHIMYLPFIIIAAIGIVLILIQKKQLLRNKFSINISNNFEVESHYPSLKSLGSLFICKLTKL